MKKTFIYFLYVMVALMATSCAKTITEGPNEAKKRYFDAWLKLNHPEAENDKVGRGIYLLSETEGNGAEVYADGYVIVNYRTKDLAGNYTAYTDEETARRLGEYDTTTYYGSTVWTTFAETMYAGVLDGVIGMKVGGKKEFIIPSWLQNYSNYSTEAQYLAEGNSRTDAIYEVEVEGYTKDIKKWQIGNIGEFFADNHDIFGYKSITDTIKGHSGCYYHSLSPQIDTSIHFPSDTTIYINYTGRLLNGLVFDTTIEKVAKDNGLYSTSRTYEPMMVQWADEYQDITMGSEGNSVIGGFALTISQMHPMEKGIGIFTADYGYSYSGSGSSIPPYAPLIFEIEIVEEPED